MEWPEPGRTQAVPSGRRYDGMVRGALIFLGVATAGQLVVALLDDPSHLAGLILLLVAGPAMIGLSTVLMLAAARPLGFAPACVSGVGFGPARFGLIGSLPTQLPSVPVILVGTVGDGGRDREPRVGSYLALWSIPLLVAVGGWLLAPLGFPLSGLLAWVAPVTIPMAAVAAVSDFMGITQYREAGSPFRVALADRLAVAGVEATSNSDPDRVLRALGGGSRPIHVLARADAHLVLGDRRAALTELRNIPEAATPPVRRRCSDLAAMARADRDPEAARQVLVCYRRFLGRNDPVCLVGAIEAAVTLGDSALARKAAIEFNRVREGSSLPLHPALERRVDLALQRLAGPSDEPSGRVAGFPVLAVGGLHAVADDDGRREHDRAHGETGDDGGDEPARKAGREPEEEQHDRRAEQAVAESLTGLGEPLHPGPLDQDRVGGSGLAGPRS